MSNSTESLSEPVEKYVEEKCEEKCGEEKYGEEKCREENCEKENCGEEKCGKENCGEEKCVENKCGEDICEVERTAGPDVDIKTSSCQISNCNGETFLLTGIFIGPDSRAYGITVAHPFKNMGDEAFMNIGPGSRLKFSTCVVYEPDFIVAADGGKNTSDTVILLLDNLVSNIEPKVELKYTSKGCTVSYLVQPKLCRDDILQGSEVWILNQYGRVVEGFVQEHKDVVEVYMGDQKVSEKYHRVIAISCPEKNGVAITYKGDSGALCFLKPDPGDTEIKVFGMAISCARSKSYVIHLPKVLDSIMKSLFPLSREFQVNFCNDGEKKKAIVTRADSGISIGDTGGNNAMDIGATGEDISMEIGTIELDGDMDISATGAGSAMGLKATRGDSGIIDIGVTGSESDIDIDATWSESDRDLGATGRIFSVSGDDITMGVQPSE